MVARGNLHGLFDPVNAVLILPFSRSRKPPTEELANESRSTHITVAADMVFSLSHYLSGVSRDPRDNAMWLLTLSRLQSSTSSVRFATFLGKRSSRRAYRSIPVCSVCRSWSKLRITT